MGMKGFERAGMSLVAGGLTHSLDGVTTEEPVSPSGDVAELYDGSSMGSATPASGITRLFARASVNTSPENPRRPPVRTPLLA
jgi:hypothetical protein